MIAIATVLAAIGLRWAWTRPPADPLEQGFAAYARGEWQEAARIARERLKASADNPTALRLMARASVRLGRTAGRLRSSIDLGQKPCCLMTCTCWESRSNRTATPKEPYRSGNKHGPRNPSIRRRFSS